MDELLTRTRPQLNAFKRAALEAQGYLLVDVAPTEPEFDEVVRAAGVPNLKHPKYPLIVERVYNPTLEAAFDRRVAAITKQRGQTPYLRFPMFHGTTEEALNNIMRTGFDPSRNRVSAYGRGTYFARNYTTSRDYSRTDSHGYKIMFVCKVIQGVSGPGRPNEVINTRVYDSHQSACDTILVSPYADGAVPLYVLRFYEFVP